MEQTTREKHATFAFPKPYHLTPFSLCFFPHFMTSNGADAGGHASIYMCITMAMNMDHSSLTIFKVSETWYDASHIP